MKKNENIAFGVLNKEYALGRKTKLSLRYRLKRRTYEVIQSIYKHHPQKVNDILDVGTAEGAMLGLVKKSFPKTQCVGLEYSKELIKMNRNKNIRIIQGDAQNLPFKNNDFNIIIATAIIEHLPQPSRLLTESYRVLKKNGLLILTTPDPFFDKIAEILNREESDHQKTFDLKSLKTSFQKSNFHVLHAGKFMMSPIGFPVELKIEKIMKFFKLDFMLFNQLIIGKK